MARARQNPFDQGTAMHLLFRRMRDAENKASVAKRHADSYAADYEAESAKAREYGKALDALGFNIVGS